MKIEFDEKDMEYVAKTVADILEKRIYTNITTSASFDAMCSHAGLPVRIHASRHVDIGQRERYNERISDRMIVLCDETLPQRIHPESTYILVETV